MIILPGPASLVLGKRIADILNIEAHPVDHRVFPDGESYIRFTYPTEGEAAIIVQTTSPPQDTHLMQLYMMTATAADLGAEKVICVVPYLAYARQDKRFLEGESLSLEIVLRLIENAGASHLVVIDAHNANSLKKIQKNCGISIMNLSAIPVLADYLKHQGYGGAYSLGPDRGAIHLAKMGGQVLSGGFGYFEKRRDRRTGEIEMVAKNLDIDGRDAVVFDDIVSSGGTMARAVVELKAQGARHVAVACTHALFQGGAENRINEAGADDIVATDSVQTKYSYVSVAGLIADYIREIIR
jgi:ribose-phosphate pyrophosphokinase